MKRKMATTVASFGMLAGLLGACAGTAPTTAPPVTVRTSPVVSPTVPAPRVAISANLVTALRTSDQLVASALHQLQPVMDGTGAASPGAYIAADHALLSAEDELSSLAAYGPYAGAGALVGSTLGDLILQINQPSANRPAITSAEQAWERAVSAYDRDVGLVG